MLNQDSLGQLTTALALPWETSHPLVDSISTALISYIHTHIHSLSLSLKRTAIMSLEKRKPFLISGALENRANGHLEDSPTLKDMARTLSRNGCTS